jgi:hypothetical protein
MSTPQTDDDLSVSERVVRRFIAAVAEDSELTEVAARLRDAFSTQSTPAETALRQALFGDPSL